MKYLKEELNKLSHFRIIKNKVLENDFFKLCFSYDAFISGSFAKDLIAHGIINNSDVDIFFPSKKAFEDCVRAVQELGIDLRIRSEYGSYVYEAKDALLIDGEAKTFQLIKSSATLAIDQFDFINCKVAIYKDFALLHKDFLKYEKDHVLELDDSSEFCASRLENYLGKGYQAFGSKLCKAICHPGYISYFPRIFALCGDRLPENVISSCFDIVKTRYVNQSKWMNSILIDDISMQNCLKYRSISFNKGDCLQVRDKFKERTGIAVAIFLKKSKNVPYLDVLHNNEIKTIHMGVLELNNEKT